MAKKTIVVKPGETLWDIAQRELGTGARWRELGAQIGVVTEEEARRLRPGTVLTIPEAPKVPPVTPPPVTPSPIAPAVAPPVTPLPIEEIKKVIPASPYDTPEVREIKRRMEEIIKPLEEKIALLERAEAAGLEPGEEIPDYVIAAGSPEEVAALRKPKRIEELEKLAFAPPPKTYEEIFTEAMKAAGMENIRKRIEDLDTKILKKKEDLITAETEIIENPWLSEAGRVGRIRKLYDIAQREINLLMEQRRSMVEEYKTGVEAAEKVAERTLKGWEVQAKRYEAELEYLTRTGKGEEIVSWSELEKINARLPVGKKLPYGTTKKEVIGLGIVPEEIKEDWMEFTDLEKRKLVAAGIDWKTPEGFKRAVDYLYREEITVEQYKAGLLTDKVEGMSYEDAITTYGAYISKDWIDWVYGEKKPKTAKEKAEAILYKEMLKWLEKVEKEPDKYVIKSDGIYEVIEGWWDKKVYEFKK